MTTVQLITGAMAEMGTLHTGKAVLSRSTEEEHIYQPADSPVAKSSPHRDPI